MTRYPLPTLVCAALLLPACVGQMGTLSDAASASGDASTTDASASDDSGATPTDAERADASGGDAALSDAAGPGDAAVVEDAAASAFTPYFFEDFESYAVGDGLSGPVFDAAGRTRASDEEAARGERSARMEIASGDGGGFGRWGGIVPIDPPLTAGQEIWVRLDVYWPRSFEFSASPWMKFLRLHSRSSDRSNGGYNDLYIDEADATTSVLRTIKEGHDRWEVYDGDSISRDRWERYEMYLSIDDRPAEDGGAGRVRIWRDGVLIFDREDVPTIPDADGDIDAFYLFTYWNNESPPDNHCFVDDLVIATSESPPPGRDADGNVRIGDWTP